MSRKNEEVKAGTIILSENPFVYALSSKFRTQLCDYCFQKGELRKCSKCHFVSYCGKECQKGAWSLHKLECSNLKRIYPRQVPNAALLLARLIQKLQHKGGHSVKSYYGPNKFRMFKDLMSHYPDVKEDKVRMEHYTSLVVVLKLFLGDDYLINGPELLGIYGRMCINSFNICDEELNSLGTGIYLAASILDHSCQPNAVAVFKGTQINVRTTQTLPYLDWNKVRISYIDTLQLPQVRQEELLSTYYFLCECSRCVDVEEIKCMTAAACPNLKCDSCVDIKNKVEDEFRCNNCQTIIPSTLVKKYEDVTELSDYHLRNMKLAFLDVCKVCLQQQAGVLHTLNIQRIRILDAAFESSIDFKQWDDAKQFGIELLNGYRKYLGEIHPLTGLLYLKLSKLLIYQECNDEARHYLKQACKILKITHGDSQLFKREVVPLYHSLSS